MIETDFREVYENTQSVYEKQAADWHSIRTQTLFEKPFLDHFISLQRQGASLLDLGCGSGVAIAQYFLEAGFKVTGIDYSKTMIDLAQKHYPDGEWHVQDIRDIQFDEKFDAVYSWHGFFHLSVSEQKDALPKIVDCVKSGGSLMLTVGTAEGEVTGYVGEDMVYHASLHPDDYKTRLKSLGFKTVEYRQEEIESQGPHVVYASGKT